MRVVVIGGFGNFGARICKRLAEEPGLEVIATTRGPLGQSASGAIGATVLDVQHQDFPLRLKTLKPDLVIHCAGPFQGQSYDVALAALDCGADYLDLADGRDFVAGFVRAVGPAAQAGRRSAVTGASTLPALSAAVIDSLRGRLSALREIEIVIAPAQQAPRGAATVAAVLSYAGRPFSVWQEGAWRTMHGWQELKRVPFSFGCRFAAACDVPDLVLLPDRYPGVQSVTFRAALEVPLQHFGLWALAALRRAGVPLPVERWGAGFARVASWLNPLGSTTGGMRVGLVGSDSAQEMRSLIWELVAPDNHGPEIPCMAAALLACKLNRGDRLPVGAHVCVGMLSLSDFETEFRRWSISTSVTASG